MPATAASQQPAGGAGASAGGGADNPPAASADAVAAWCTEALGTHCSLVRQQPGARTAFHTRRRHSQESAAQEAQETIGAQILATASVHRVGRSACSAVQYTACQPQYTDCAVWHTELFSIVPASLSMSALVHEETIQCHM